MKNYKKNITKIIILSFFAVLVPSVVLASIHIDPTFFIFASTKEATNITQTTATLHGTGGYEEEGSTLPLTAYFRYSVNPISPVYCNNTYGTDMTSTKDIKLGITNGTSFYQNIAGLSPNTTYYYCAIVSNRESIAYAGSIMVKQFHTNCLTTTVETKEVKNIQQSYATLTGNYCSTKNVATSFKYKESWSGTGTPPDWITVGKADHSPGRNSNVYGNISFNLSNLKPNQKYESRAVAKNGSESFEGATVEFITLASSGGGGGSTNSGSSGGIYTGGGSTYTGGGTGSGGGGSSGGNTYTGGGTGSGGRSGGGGGNTYTGSSTSGANVGIINTTPLSLNQVITPPNDAIVRSREGIETVFARQIMADIEFAKKYGYTDGIDIQNFAWNLSHQFAQMFGYVNSSGKEIRVSFPDIAAYQLQLIGNKLTVYEYYSGKIIDVRNATTVFKSTSIYEYYFKK